jgi:hypothetical protein
MSCPATPQNPSSSVEFFGYCVEAGNFLSAAALFASALAAIFGILASARLQRSFERNAQSRLFLLNHPSNARVYQVIEKNRRSSERDINNQEKRIILEHYEYLCGGIRHGDVDENLIFFVERDYLVSEYEKFEAYILGIQKRQPKALENFQIIAERWRLKSRRGLLQIFFEWTLHRPIFAWTRLRLRLKRRSGGRDALPYIEGAGVFGILAIAIIVFLPSFLRS